MIQKEALWSHVMDEKEIKSNCTLFRKMEKKGMLFFTWFLVLLPEFKTRAGVEKPCWKCLWVGFKTTFTVFVLFVLEPEGVMGILVSGIKKKKIFLVERKPSSALSWCWEWWWNDATFVDFCTYKSPEQDPPGPGGPFKTDASLFVWSLPGFQPVWAANWSLTQWLFGCAEPSTSRLTFGCLTHSLLLLILPPLSCSSSFSLDLPPPLIQSSDPVLVAPQWSTTSSSSD